VRTTLLRTFVRTVIGVALVLALVYAVSPVYRDFFDDRRDRYKGSSFAVHSGPLDYDRQVLRDFSWGAWFWDPYRGMGMPRLQDLGMRPLYPVQLVLARFLPTLAAWHWNHVLHVVLKAVGLVLLGSALGWPFWVVIAASAGAMLAEGSLVQFTDTTMLLTAAWLPLQMWLTVKAAGRATFSGWDAAWAVAAALRVLSFHPQYGAYYEVLIILFTIRMEWGQLRRRLPALVLRYVGCALLLAPALLPGYAHYADSGRRHIAEFDDWPMRRAYLWWKYGLHWSDFLTSAFAPLGVWLTVLVGALIGPVRSTVLWPVFAGYLVFALFHAVPWLAFPMWVTGIAIFPFRIPQRVFEPFMWLGILLLAEQVTRETRRARRSVLAGLLLVALASCAWQTSYDPRTTYVMPRWERQLPAALAAHIRSQPATRVLMVTGPDRMNDPSEPILNSNHADFLRIPAIHFAGQLPSYHFNRMTYRLPGLILLPRGPTSLEEWEAAVEVYRGLGVGWVIWDGAGEPVHPALHYEGEEAGFRLYAISGAPRMVSAAETIRSVPRPSQMQDVTALVYSIPALGPFCYDCPAGRVWSAPEEVTLKTDWRAGHVRIEVESPRGTFLILSENYSIGWHATVSGHEVPIYQVNEALQGVSVPPGQHVVVWRFASPGFFAGLWIAGIGAVGLALGPMLARRFGR
jgi:hypothetical protein